MKEISYIPSDAYAAGEMKHGPIALLDETTPVVCVATDSPILEKVLSNMAEVGARGADVIAIGTEGTEDEVSDACRPVPVHPAHRLDPAADPGGDPAPAAGLPHGENARSERGPAQEPGEDRHRRIALATRPGAPRDSLSCRAMKNRLLSPLLLLIAALAAAVALAACGDDDSPGEDVGDLGPDPATMAPVEAPVYFEVTVRPEGDMLESFNSTIGKLTGGQEPGELIQQGIDSELAEDELSYAEDIEPWLGQRMGGFVTEFDPMTEDGEGAVAIAVSDADAAQEFLEKARETGDEPGTDETYNGVDYVRSDGAAIGIDGDFMLIGTEQGFQDAVDAGAGDSLADDSEASSEREDVPENSIFSAYVDTQAVIDLIESSGELTGEQLKQFEDQIAQYSEGPISFWGVAADDAISLAGSAPAPTDSEGPSDLVSTFPSDAWLAFAAGDFGAQLEASLDAVPAGVRGRLREHRSPRLPGAEHRPAR